MITIYGLFIDGRCVYVGRTKDLGIRMPSNNRRCFRLFGKLPTVRSLKRVHPDLASDAEWELIKEFKALGQADLNKLAAARRTKRAPDKINLTVFKDDLEWFDVAADSADRSRIRMFRYVVSQWKAGQPVLLTTEPQANGARK